MVALGKNRRMLIDPRVVLLDRRQMSLPPLHLQWTMCHGPSFCDPMYNTQCDSAYLATHHHYRLAHGTAKVDQGQERAGVPGGEGTSAHPANQGLRGSSQ